MQDIKDQLQNLEQDGKQYAHFLSHPKHPGYYGVWVREKTAEYVSLWLTDGPLTGYTLVASVEMPDVAFTDYMDDLFPNQVSVPHLKKLYAINSLTQTLASTLATSFKSWKQEKILLNRTKWLSQYPWVTNSPTENVSTDNN